jgi:hypothetical protein
MPSAGNSLRLFAFLAHRISCPSFRGLLIPQFFFFAGGFRLFFRLPRPA